VIEYAKWEHVVFSSTIEEVFDLQAAAVRICEMWIEIGVP
jgi:hypothetical protein